MQSNGGLPEDIEAQKKRKARTDVLAYTAEELPKSNPKKASKTGRDAKGKFDHRCQHGCA